MSRINSKIVVPNSLHNALDPIANRFMRDVQASLESVQRFPIATGALIPGLAIGTTKTLVQHGLGRKYQGWFVLDLDSPVTIHRDTTAEDDPVFFLPLISTATASVITLWVF